MIDFIININAHRGKAAAIAKKLSDRLSAAGVEFKFHRTLRRGHAKELARKICARKGEKTVVAVGGDGTVHEVLNGLDDFKNLTFGVIPAGTGNDFAASLGISEKPMKALSTVLDGNCGYVDFYECGGVRGANIAGAGIDVDILKHYATKKHRGKLQYALSLLHCIMHFKPYTVNDEGKEKKIFIATVCNGRQFGGGIKICPAADPADGKLDKLVVGELPRRKFLFALIRLATGKITKISTCEYSRAESAAFGADLSIEIDGEIYEGIPFDVKIIPATLKMLLPNKRSI